MGRKKNPKNEIARHFQSLIDGDKGGIRGAGVFHALFEELQSDLAKVNQEGIKAAAHIVKERAKALAPEDTGGVKQSIRVFFRSRNIHKSRRFFVVRAGGFVTNKRVLRNFLNNAPKKRRKRDVYKSKRKTANNNPKIGVYVWWAAAANSRHFFMQRAINASKGEAVNAYKNIWTSAMNTRKRKVLNPNREKKVLKGAREKWAELRVF